MPGPHSFSWVDKPLLAASGYPHDIEDLFWLREEGIDILLSLTEDPIYRKDIDIAGLMSVHIPVPDMTPPSIEQIQQCLAVIEKARESKMAVNVHCLYGKGRTGTILGAYFISQGMTPDDAINKVRELRPGSIETIRQEDRLYEFAKLNRQEA
jgi:atypical dual specificity phosphatase